MSSCHPLTLPLPLELVSLVASKIASGLQVLQSDVRTDLMVTDVALPGGINEWQVADVARMARPGLKVLSLLGYAQNAVLSHDHLDLSP